VTDPGPPAVVVGLDCVTGLQTARILAARGVGVVGIATDPRHFCCRTRACGRVVHADTAGSDLVDALGELAPQLQPKPVLFPCTDMSVLVISRHRERLRGSYHVVLPDADVVEMLMDKRRFYEYATSVGLPVPRTVLLASRSEAEQVGGTLTFPVVLKPPIKTPVWDAHAAEKAYKVSNERELLAVYDGTRSLTDVLLAQEWIAGDETAHYTCNCYFDAASKPVVTFVTRKIRQWPPGTGSASLAVEARNDEVLGETIRLYERVDFRGLGYLEMKQDAKTGRHLIVEPNIGRPTGRSAAAEAAGVEFLYTKYCDAVGLPRPERLDQRYTDLQWIYFGRDVRSAAYHWRRRELSLIEWWRSWRGRKVDAVFSRRDPLPFVLDASRGVPLVLRLLRRRAQRRPVEDGVST
jgi:D-aspartate ligase